MKFRKIIYATFVSVVLISAGGCKKDKFNINSNPDDVTDVSVTPSVLLPGALQNTSRFVAVDWAFLQMWMGYWARSGSYQSLTEIETYKFGNDFQVAVWNDIYANTNNYDIMQRKAKAAGSGFYEAIARIMKAHNFGILVDVYNNVPYFDAFKGTVTSTPKYDKGADIYKDLFKQLDTALTLLNTPDAIAPANNADIATADLAYKGNATQWKKFANTLRLRLLIHLHNGLTTNTVAAGFNIAEETAKFTASGFAGFLGTG
ncbi:MAG TPA: SusD/RagB family nutrient-binding outer membrane lipoprotein, partial [Flavisolibacter sp.]|nr:SusD/RagB family nutrient-binding outer membrane lipoprotein [Flavisolibacter sp.]